jgi:predicted Zn-dependent peptidase
MSALGMEWRLVHLPSGLRLITIVRPGTPTVAVRAYVRAGSRYDAEQEHPGSDAPPSGLAHLAEHLLFEGTRLHSQQELFSAVERLGGVLEAGTAKEYVSLYAVTPRHGLATALDVLAEILTEPALTEESFWAEKLVVLEEIRRAQDRQQATLFDLLAATLWQEHPLRHSVLGTVAGLHELEYKSLASFYRQRYVAGNMVLAVCGDIEHEEVRRLVVQRFRLPAGPEQPPAPLYEPPLAAPRQAHLEKDTHQLHLAIGVPTIGMKHEDRSALKVVERVLGMGGSARLYQRLREEQRLVYSVNTVTAHYEDTGFFAVDTACDPRNVTQVRQAILEEWDKIRQRGVSEEELSAAKSNYAGTLARRFETNLALAGIAGVEGLLHRVETPDEAIARIGAVRQDDVLRVAQRYLDVECYVETSVGKAGEGPSVGGET